MTDFHCNDIQYSICRKNALESSDYQELLSFLIDDDIERGFAWKYNF